MYEEVCSRSTVRERVARGSKRGRTRNLLSRERRSHAVCGGAGRAAKRREEARDKTGRSSLSRGARTPRDYKEEPLNRGPGPLQGIEVLPSWLNQQRCISTMLTPNPTTTRRGGPSSSITSGRGTRLRRLLGSLPIGFAPHSCNQPTMTLR